MAFKFEKLEVWQLALDYIDLAYKIGNQLPKSEEYNLRSQLVRAATSIALNIAEGSTGQTDSEQSRFLGLAVRSLLETGACYRILERQALIREPSLLAEANRQAEKLAAKFHALRQAVAPEKNWLREEPIEYTLSG